MVVVQLKEKYYQRYEVLRDQMVLSVITLVTHHKKLVEYFEYNYCCHDDDVLEWRMVKVVDFVENYYWGPVVAGYILVFAVGILDMRIDSLVENCHSDRILGILMMSLENRDGNLW